ncbi:hypothetical protein [Bdellovibrio sp. HCB209]|uniref:hypothetical protein n=1 Tax=Bdellovibrio sp. HCB209 TaxID=3394354 RepID=UPI0039B63331
MRAFLCCLMLGLTILKYGTEMTSEFASTAPRAPWNDREGIYSLVNGADNCPSTMTWIEQCGGFVLNPRHKDRELETVRICNINKGAKISRGEFGKMLAQADQKDQYVRKIEKSLLATESLTLNEDIVILDKDRQSFQWEHSQNGRGLSCLYSK